MKKMLIILLLGILFIAASEQHIQRESAIIRSGPGIFFEKIGTLEKGNKVQVQDEKNGWLKIDFNEESYITAKALQKPSKMGGVFQQMGTQTTDLQASRHGLSAGIKGFAAKFTKSVGSFEQFQNRVSETKLNKKLYRKIKKRQKKARKSLNYVKGNLPLPASGRDNFSREEKYVGRAFASSIAALGLYENDEIEEFLNVFGNLIVEGTEFYDQRFYIYVLDTDKVNAYACPGGIIFLTRGILEATENEAELAFVIAHELAHTIYQHGLQGMKERKNLIKADNAFAEMEAELDELGVEQDAEMKAVEEELEQELFNFYETVFSGRLEKYEFEADRMGLLYMQRSGYNGANAKNILVRLIYQERGSTNEHYTKQQLEDRLENLKRQRIISVEDHEFTNWQKIKQSL